MKKRLTVILILILNCGLLTAQDKVDQDAIGELRKLMQTYRQSDQLSFDIGYYYSDTKNPAEILDSLQGSCKLKGSSYWTTIDNTETLFSSGIVVVLYKDDQIMYFWNIKATKHFIFGKAVIMNILDGLTWLS